MYFDSGLQAPASKASATTHASSERQHTSGRETTGRGSTDSAVVCRPPWCKEMMVRSLFKPFKEYTSPTEVLSTSNVLGRLTGGLKDLYRQIGTKETPRPHIAGKCTADNGRFTIPHRAARLAQRYQMLDVIGKGTFAVFIEARDMFYPGGRQVGIKIFDVQNKNLGCVECQYMREINSRDLSGCAHIIQLFNAFILDEHVCLVYELLSSRRLHHGVEVIPMSEDFQHKRLKFIRKIAIQVLTSLSSLSMLNIIHADLKPENILFVHDSPTKSTIKLIDFGNALHCTSSEIDPYRVEFEVQSLWYRAPEVLLGVEVGLPIDVWSLGCILIELYVGRPVFEARQKQDLLDLMVRLLGPVPDHIYNTRKFKDLVASHCQLTPEVCRLKASENIYKLFKKMKRQGRQEREFADFLSCLLCYSPRARARPSQALLHPFLRHEFPLRFCIEEPYNYGVTGKGGDFEVDQLPSISLPSNLEHLSPLLSSTASSSLSKSCRLIAEETGSASGTGSEVAVEPGSNSEEMDSCLDDCMFDKETEPSVKLERRKVKRKRKTVSLKSSEMKFPHEEGLVKAETSESEDDIILLKVIKHGSPLHHTPCL